MNELVALAEIMLTQIKDLMQDENANIDRKKAKKDIARLDNFLGLVEIFAPSELHISEIWVTLISDVIVSFQKEPSEIHFRSVTFDVDPFYTNQLEHLHQVFIVEHHLVYPYLVPVRPSLDSEIIESLPSKSFGQLDKIWQSKDKHCAICMEVYQTKDTLLILPCNHLYHKECIQTWFNKSHLCPYCRLDLKNIDQRH